MQRPDLGVTELGDGLRHRLLRQAGIGLSVAACSAGAPCSANRCAGSVRIEVMDKAWPGSQVGTGGAVAETRPIRDLTPGVVVVLPTTVDGSTIGPLVVEWVQEDVDGTVCVGWHACREDHELRLPLNMAARGALVLTRATAPPAPGVMHHAA